MSRSSTPANLSAYYCEACSGIIVTSDTEKVEEKYGINCPFCSGESLTLLDNEFHQNNFDPSLFPSPQNLLLKNFFERLPNSKELFDLFGRNNPIELILQGINYHEDNEYTIILIDPKLYIDCQLFLKNNGFTSWRGSGDSLIARLTVTSS